MRSLRHDLFRQLISIGIIIFGILLISLGLILPKVLMPVYERNIYNYLKEPLEFVDTRIEKNELLHKIAYLYITPDEQMIISDNFAFIIDLEPQQILTMIDEEYGKFKHHNNTYYYYTSIDEYVSKIAITDNYYIHQMQKDIVLVIFPLLLITLIIVLALIISWSRRLILKIYYLRDKILHLDDKDYFKRFNDEHHLDDELNSLSVAIDDMHVALKAQEDYKNQMYQNISHDFKAPLTVMKSYIEAVEDNVLSKEEAITIIHEQILKLENKVHSLLYLNKLNYLQEDDNYEEEDIEIVSIIEEAVEKFKYENPKLEWQIKSSDKEIFKGTFDMWEAIIDNMFNNFVRYANSKIKITIKNNEIIFYNDGPNIDEAILDELFTPYKKGINGKFGLGLSIIKKSLCLMGYKIIVNNEKKGVSFKIVLDTEKEC